MSAYVGSTLKSDIEQSSGALKVNAPPEFFDTDEKNLRDEPKAAPHSEERDEALVRAFKAVGGQTAMGLLLGRKKQAVWHWKRVPPHFVIRVEELTGISRSELRPDLYPPSDGLVPGRLSYKAPETVSRAA